MTPACPIARKTRYNDSDMQKEGGPLQVNQVRLGAVLSYVSMGLSTLISLIYTPIMLGRLGETD